VEEGDEEERDGAQKQEFGQAPQQQGDEPGPGVVVAVVAPAVLEVVAD
jgi:hypothetical protein